MELISQRIKKIFKINSLKNSLKVTDVTKLRRLCFCHNLCILRSAALCPIYVIVH